MLVNDANNEGLTGRGAVGPAVVGDARALTLGAGGAERAAASDDNLASTPVMAVLMTSSVLTIPSTFPPRLERERERKLRSCRDGGCARRNGRNVQGSKG
jgi:hypothetical protein